MMNKRIKELAEQAGFETDRGPLIGPSPYIKVGGLCVGVPLEKFVALIIQECAGVDLYWLSEQDRKAVAEKIKQHFGLE